MPDPQRPPTSELNIEARLQKLVRAAAIEGVVLLVGIVGYLIIGAPKHGLVDAIYMTMITLTTVGYEEAIELSGKPGAKLFTSALLVVGVGSFAYLFSNLTVFAFEGGFGILWRRRTVRRSIENLRDHYIVCGLGETGLHAAMELEASGRPYIAIDSDAERVDELREYLGAGAVPLTVVGDATEDSVLREARIEHARGLIACVRNDKDGLIIVVTARLLHGDLRIIARCHDTRVKKKIIAAGADRVVSPSLIGGRRLVSSMVRPMAVSFFDSLVGSSSSVRVEDVPVSPASSYAHVTVGELRSQQIPDLLILALRSAKGEWRYNPGDGEALHPGASVIFMGTLETRRRLAAMLAP